MIEVKMLTGLCGPAMSLTRGDIHTCEDPAEAVRLVRGNLAEPVDKDAFAEAEKAFDAAHPVADTDEPAVDDAVDDEAAGAETPANEPATETPEPAKPATAAKPKAAAAKAAAKA